MTRPVAIVLLCCAVFFLAFPSEALTLRHEPIVIDYDASEEALAQRTLDILVRSVDEFKTRLPAGTDPIRVILCGTQQEFVRHAEGYTMPAVLGIASPERGIIVLKAPELAQGPADYRGTVRHELVHVLFARNVGAENVPRWFNEGIAMVVSGEYRFESTARVAQMYMSGKTIDYRNLDLVFLSPGRELEFGDAYAQSLSMTRFLVRRLGEDRFWEFARSLRTKPFERALEDSLGMKESDFYKAWLGSLWKFALLFSLVSGFSIFQVMALLTFMAYVRKRRRGKQVMREWANEESEAMEELSGDEDVPGDFDSEYEDYPSCEEYDEDNHR